MASLAVGSEMLSVSGSESWRQDSLPLSLWERSEHSAWARRLVGPVVARCRSGLHIAGLSPRWALAGSRTGRTTVGRRLDVDHGVDAAAWGGMQGDVAAGGAGEAADDGQAEAGA